MTDSCGGLLDAKTLHVGLWRDFTTIGGYHSSGYFIFHHDDHEGWRPSGSSRNVLYNLPKVKLACSVYIAICVVQVSLNTWSRNCIEQGCMASLLNSNVHAIDWRMGRCSSSNTVRAVVLHFWYLPCLHLSNSKPAVLSVAKFKLFSTRSRTFYVTLHPDLKGVQITISHCLRLSPFLTQTPIFPPSLSPHALHHSSIIGILSRKHTLDCNIML